MIELILDLLQFLRSYFPFLFSVLALGLFFASCANIVRKYYYVFYTVFILLMTMIIVPSFLTLLGVKLPFNLIQMPVLGTLLKDFFHMRGIGHPIFFFVMFTGALDPKTSVGANLYSIRKKLAIMGGFAVLAHVWVRITRNVANAIANNGADMTDATGFAYFLGFLLFFVFIVLWISSFEKIHKALGGQKWKKIHKAAYLFYALMFLHAVFIHTGKLMSEPNAKSWCALASYLIAYGVYICLKLRKSRKKIQAI